MKSDGSDVHSLFFGNNRQHMPVCTKMISSWFRIVFSIAKSHMFPGTPCDAAMSAALVAGVCLVCVLWAGDWARVSTTARHYFLLTMDQHQDSIHCTFLSLSE